MTAVKQQRKWYVVWRGRKTGIFKSWKQCCGAVNGYPGAQFKAFQTEIQAIKAFGRGPQRDVPNRASRRAAAQAAQRLPDTQRVPEARRPVVTPARWAQRSSAASQQSFDFGPEHGSLCVDGSWHPVRKHFEYQCVWYPSLEPAFRSDCYPNGSINLAEFLAVVQGLRIVAESGRQAIVYTDSLNAMAWVKNQEIRSNALNSSAADPEVLHLVADALYWLKRNDHAPVVKWQTKVWGENPADFGRK